MSSVSPSFFNCSTRCDMENRLLADKSLTTVYNSLKMIEFFGKLTESETRKKISILKEYQDLKRFVCDQLEVNYEFCINEKVMEKQAKNFIEKHSAPANSAIAEDVILHQVDQLLNAQMSNRAETPPKVDHSKCLEKSQKLKSQLDEAIIDRDKTKRVLQQRLEENRNESKSYKERIKDLHAQIKSLKSEKEQQDMKIKKLTTEADKAIQEKCKLKLHVEQRSKEIKQQMKEMKRKISTMPVKDARIAELEKQLREQKWTDENSDPENSRPECSICTDNYSPSHQPVG